MPAPRVPDPLDSYLGSLTDDAWLERASIDDVLRLLRVMPTALRAYREDAVAAARLEGRSWQEIGDALGMAKQNTHRAYRHLDAEPSNP